MNFTDHVLATLSASHREAISALLQSTSRDTATGSSHGELDVPKLVRMLLQDVAHAVHRPGSWEGANMRQLLAGHGYTSHEHNERCARARLAYWGGTDPYATSER